MSFTILNPTTALAASDHIHLGNDQKQMLLCNGLQGAEKGHVQMSNDDATSFFNIWDRDGKVEFGMFCNSILLEGPGTFRVLKDATASPVGITVSGLACGT